jgi:hypothetical protein
VRVWRVSAHICASERWEHPVIPSLSCLLPNRGLYTCALVCTLLLWRQNDLHSSLRSSQAFRERGTNQSRFTVLQDVDLVLWEPCSRLLSSTNIWALTYHRTYADQRITSTSPSTHQMRSVHLPRPSLVLRCAAHLLHDVSFVVRHHEKFRRYCARAGCCHGCRL